ncbi:MAG: hypothetical protein IKA41_02115 [Bacteroidaceae bacterium]|nr:hypothetical protein [Bacteroidaceae bacterium]
MFGITDMLNRLRHNRGYGVQSPAAFFFVTHILRTKMPYYIYPTIDKIADKMDNFSSAHYRRLFRITNYLRPRNIIMFDTDDRAAQCAIASGKRVVPCHIIGKQEHNIPVADKLLKERNAILNDKCSIDELKSILDKEQIAGLIYLGKCNRLNEVLEILLPHINNQSAIIVEGIHRNKNMSNEWEKAQKNERCIVTYDLYSMGILLFDSEYKKQHFSLNYR